MGLDQYASARRGEAKKDEDGYTYYEDSMELAYWRKHPNIHGFMERLYREKGGEEVFNCRPVVLTQEDIDRLASIILDKELPETSGFFFGSSFGDEDEENDDLEFCRKASEAIKEGYTVYYDSWW